MHMLIHSTILSSVCYISFTYFKKDQNKAMLVALILLSNQELREFQCNMFNDSFLAFYVVMCILSVQANRPLLAAFFLTLGLSIKAGVILLIPSFLGWVQY